MSVELYPCFLQDEEYSAETLRHVFGSLLARGSAIGSIVGGLVASTDMKVTAGSGMQVLVATGEAWIPGTSVSTQGGYLGRVTSSTALAISASSESNNREDTIIAQVQDKAVAGGTDSFTVSVVTGTAESGVTKGSRKGVGAVPASSLVLGYVFVEKKAVSIVSGDIENVAALVDLGVALEAGAVTGPQLGLGTVRQETGTAQGFLSWGKIGELGEILAGSGDYTVAWNSSGLYTINWTKAKASAKYAVVATGGTPGYDSVIASVTTTTTYAAIQLLVGTTKAGEFIEATQEFSFIALGAS